ncbi:hypothetical protein M569_08965 [Genlisea aurea]|uniref:Uncharacterized protein n=1 Tax=Genlisea aurea TaxID=192259 RepID=S8CFU9_9LAMI|nr:hypothetical protein M569_08965 [Genlisea aurea]
MAEASFGSLSDSKSLLSNTNHLLRLTTQRFELKRGPRFREYSDLREKKLKMRYFRGQHKNLDRQHADENFLNRSILWTPPRKPSNFASSNFVTPPRRSKNSSPLTHSVPDFSSALRKENRKPAATLPPLAEKSLTPPSKAVKVSDAGKSKSVNSANKHGGGNFMIRKSYATIDDFKSSAAAENRTRNSRATSRNILGNY